MSSKQIKVNFEEMEALVEAPAAEPEPVAPEPAKPVEAAPEKAKRPERPLEFSPSPPPRMRISQDAWDATPDVIKSEACRMLREFEAGFRKHAPAYERDTALAPFHEMAKANGTTLGAVLAKYIEMENLLRTDFDKGVETLCANLGTTPKHVARRFLQRDADRATIKAAGVHLAHEMFLAAAARAIRDEPDKLWRGLHFGVMAQEAQLVCPDCVVKQPNGYLAVDYDRLSEAPEARSLPVYSYRYKDGGMGNVA
jgi:hypothetical protein